MTWAAFVDMIIDGTALYGAAAVGNGAHLHGDAADNRPVLHGAPT